MAEDFEKCMEEQFRTLKITPPKINGSLNELFSVKTTQSINIQVGNKIETAISNFISSIQGVLPLDDIKIDKEVKSYLVKEKLGKIQTDLLFQYEEDIYYLEVKSNINLDTEKSDAVKQKLTYIENFLKQQFPNRKIISKVLLMRFAERKNPHVKRLIKSPLTIDDLMFPLEFFSLFGIKYNAKQYYSFFYNNLSDIIKTIK